MTTPSTPYPRSARPGGPPGAEAGPPQDREYVSPIPVRRAHLGDAVVAEWTKIRTLRSTIWSLGAMVLLVVGVGVAVAWGVRVSAAGHSTEPPLRLGFFGLMLGSLCVMALGVLTFSSEYGTGLIRSTLAACPSRARVLAAKSVVYFSLIFVLTVVVTVITAVLQVVILDAPNPGLGDWVSSTVGVSLYMGLLGLLSLAVGALVRHSAAAIIVTIGVVLLPLVLALFLVNALPDVSSGLFAYSIPNQMASFYSDLSGFGDLSSPTGGESLLIIAGATAVTMAGAYLALDRRDT